MLEFVSMEYFNKKMLIKVMEDNKNALVINYCNSFGGSFYKAFACDTYKDMLQAKNDFLANFESYTPATIKQAMCDFKLISITYYYNSGKKFVETF